MNKLVSTLDTQDCGWSDKYKVREPTNTNWFRHYLERAVSEYWRFIKYKLPRSDLYTKLRYMVANEMGFKREGYYFSMSFLDEICSLCEYIDWLKIANGI